MLTAIGNPLVVGMVANTNMAMKKLKVLRAFYIGTKVHKVGDVVDVSASLAAELINAYKAEVVPVAASTASVVLPKEKS